MTSSSSLEKCSFVCHIFVFPIGLLFLVWVLVPEPILEEHFGLDYVPRKEYATHVVPISVLLLFLVVPLIYAGLNAATVPKLDSMDTLQDMHTRRPTEEEAATNAAEAAKAATGTLPEICDLDPATLVWYPTSSNRRR